MHSTIVAVDLAKNVFELAVADAEGKIGAQVAISSTTVRFSERGISSRETVIYRPCVVPLVGAT